ncbi:hypothetical protein [Novosphingobium sp. B1]|uniref:hypothetical protein n=1 Tax=Novosphingobium sp. B1 TaxID=1938756 RepID=UPI0009D7DDC8|nr:hypothetical protein [Novosphingobium sp. B1]SMC73601.1 hypothetical protein SAMN06272759_106162 [Novosphingobium sp. B1]
MSDAEETDSPRKREWKRTLRVILYMLPWIAVWLWLKSQTGFPDRYGYHNGLHGKAGVFNEYIHSGLLLQRPGAVEIFLFTWMWAPVVGFIAWLAWAFIQDLQKGGGS